MCCVVCSVCEKSQMKGNSIDHHSPNPTDAQTWWIVMYVVDLRGFNRWNSCTGGNFVLSAAAVSVIINR